MINIEIEQAKIDIIIDYIGKYLEFAGVLITEVKASKKELTDNIETLRWALESILNVSDILMVKERR